jgi:hypothetical protein
MIRWPMVPEGGAEMTRDQWREIEKALRDLKVQLAMEGRCEEQGISGRTAQIFSSARTSSANGMANESERGYPDEKIQVATLAMRVEGENWNAYYAMPNAMEARFASAP